MAERSITKERIFFGLSAVAVIANYLMFDYKHRIEPRIHENLYRKVIQTADTSPDGTITRDEAREVYRALGLRFDKSLEEPLFYLNIEQMRDYLRKSKTVKRETAL